jgi:outer membrane protein insertion porin family
MRFCWLFLVSLLTLWPTCADDTHVLSDFLSQPVTYVRIESTAEIRAQDVLQAIPIRKNEALTPVLIRDSLKRLNLLNRFRSVSVYAEPFNDGVALIFKVEPDWLVDTIKFKGGAITVLFRYGLGGRFSPKILQRQLQIGRGDIYIDSKGQAAIAALKDFYYNNGYAQSKINLEPVYNSADATVDLVFNVNQGSPTLINDITFEGNETFANHVLMSQTGLSLEKRFSRRRLNDSRSNLEKFYKRHGYVNVRIYRPEIQYNRHTNTMSVHYKIIENDPVSITIQARLRPWNFLWQVYSLEKRPDLYLELLGMEDTAHLDSKRFHDAVKTLRKLYWNRGYLNSQITLHESRDNTGKTLYNYQIEENEPVITRDISLSGNRFFSVDDLLAENLILTQTDRRYHHDTFLADSDSVRDIYIQNGFHNIEVAAGFTLHQNETDVHLHLVVKEGPRFVWDHVKISGNTIFTDNEIQSLTGIAPETPYNFSLIETAMDSLQDAYLEKGYVDVSVTWKVMDEASTRPGLTIDISEGVPAVIDTVLIKGYNKTLRHVIERNLPELEGQPYYFRTLLQAERQLIRTNLFRSVEISTPRWEAAQPGRTLLVNLSEQPFIFLEGGPGYNTDRGFNAFVSLYTTNLGGSNRYLGASGLLSQRDHRATVVFREPEFASLPVQLELRFLTEETYEKAYTLLRRGVRSTWSYELTDRIRLLMIYRFDSDEPRSTEPDADLPEEFLNTVKIGSLAPGILYDSRDDPQAPKSGSLLSAKFEYARKMYSSEVNFTKVTTELTHFYNVSRRGVLGTSFRVGWGYDLPFQEEFRLGGIKSIRGWDFDSIRKTPTRDRDDIYSPKEKDIDVSLLANIEFRYQIFWGLESVLFFDTGNVFDQSSDIALSSLKGTIGLGIRFMTPVGPIGVDYGYNIMKDDADPSSKWSFIIGHTF